MTIRELINSFISYGFSELRAESMAAQEIIIRKIASSPFKEQVVFKGGVVMHNLSNNHRRSTIDIDFDLVRYDISNKESIDSLIDSLNKVEESYKLKRIGNIIQLHHQEYKGVRIILSISDNSYSIKIKVDIGVHTLLFVSQNKMVFISNEGTSINVLANPPEQIVAEKLFSLYKHGILSKRYKDVYDIYYLIRNYSLDKNTIEQCITIFLNDSKKIIYDVFDVIEQALLDPFFQEKLSSSESKWIDDSVITIITTIIDYIHGFY